MKMYKRKHEDIILNRRDRQMNGIKEIKLYTI